MFCKFCGKEITTHTEICPHCGARVRYSVKTTMDRLLETRPVDEEKSPSLAAALGFLLGWIFLGPLGYIYLGQWNWCWITLIAYFIAMLPSFGLVYLFYPFLLAFHQYWMAKELNAGLRERTGEGGEGGTARLDAPGSSSAGGGAASRTSSTSEARTPPAEDETPPGGGGSASP
jgi:hypothetical protein